jgi:hypothetical protein
MSISGVVKVSTDDTKCFLFRNVDIDIITSTEDV